MTAEAPGALVWLLMLLAKAKKRLIGKPGEKIEEIRKKTKLPGALNLLRAFDEGARLIIKLNAAGSEGPPGGRRWLVLYGMYYHVTGTATILIVKRNATTATLDSKTELELLGYQAAATGSGHFNIFSTEAGGQLAGYALVVLESGDTINLNGDSGVKASVVVLEW